MNRLTLLALLALAAPAGAQDLDALCNFDSRTVGGALYSVMLGDSVLVDQHRDLNLAMGTAVRTASVYPDSVVYIARSQITYVSCPSDWVSPLPDTITVEPAHVSFEFTVSITDDTSWTATAYDTAGAAIDVVPGNTYQLRALLWSAAGEVISCAGNCAAYSQLGPGPSFLEAMVMREALDRLGQGASATTGER